MALIKNEINKKVLTSVAKIQENIQSALGPSARFFIKGGAAVPLLLEGSAAGITSDIDTYLSIDPRLSPEEFEAKRIDAIKICMATLIGDFNPTVVNYQDKLMSSVEEDKCCGRRMKPFDVANPFSIYVYGRLGEREQDKQPLSLITVKYGKFITKTIRQKNGTTKTELDVKETPVLDIVIPHKEYALLQYFWETITPTPIGVEGIEKTVPVMNTVSAFVNQRYATFKTNNATARNTRKGRANALLKRINNARLNTRKQARVNALSLIPTNDKGLFGSILSMLPDAAPAVTGGVGAGAAAAAPSTFLLPASPSISPPLPPNARSAGFKPPLPPTPPPYADKYVIAPTGERYILRTWDGGMKEDILDPVSHNLLTRVTYVPITDRNVRGTLRTIYYDVYANGKHFLRFDPYTHFFSPVTMQAYPR